MCRTLCLIFKATSEFLVQEDSLTFAQDAGYILWEPVFVYLVEQAWRQVCTVSVTHPQKLSPTVTSHCHCEMQIPQQQSV